VTRHTLDEKDTEAYEIKLINKIKTFEKNSKKLIKLI
jgi:hypothetical protein